AVADPHYAYRVDGRVLLADGRPAVGVEVERVLSDRDPRPYSTGNPPASTDPHGAFRFEFSGLGWSTGRTWTLAVRRRGCPGRTVTITLHSGHVDEWDADVATDVVIRLPACRL